MRRLLLVLLLMPLGGCVQVRLGPLVAEVKRLNVKLDTLNGRLAKMDKHIVRVSNQ